ncbi:MAG: HD domain-containing phosphohydrolase [Acidobacteriota bacterium]
MTSGSPRSPKPVERIPSSPTVSGVLDPQEPEAPKKRVARLRLRHKLFLLLLVPGILPLLFSSIHLIGANKEILKTQEKELLTHSAQEFVNGLSDELRQRRLELRQLGRGIVGAPGPGTVEARLRQNWVVDLLRQFREDNPDIQVFNAVGRNRRGLQTGSPNPQQQQAMIQAFDAALRTGQPAYRFAFSSGPAGEPADVLNREPSTALAVPIPTADGNDVLVLQALVPLTLAGVTAGGQETFDFDDFFLVAADGSLLWTAGSREQIEQALLQSDLVSDFARIPTFSVSREYDLEVGGETYPTLARVVAVQETGWGLVAHKSSDKAFQQVREMVFDIVLSSVLAVMLALFFALMATRWFSRPIQQLAETSHEIAAGKFDRRVPLEGLTTVEIADMATDFNRMSDYVERYVEQLRRAAEANRALFISSIRAFAAAIDAKDPYTRGHSERVAAYSRSIARYLGLPKDVQERVWISAVLHDVGKIGVRDHVLRKKGVLTPEEFEEMKQHPSIGAEIVEPISALGDMLPGIRWHHEAWNGTGYPDKLKGESIPLMARIIGVADTFDAITTNRPYQTASSPEFATETIKKLTGTKFDAKVVTAFLLAWDAGHIGLDREKAEETSARLAGQGAPATAAAN